MARLLYITANIKEIKDSYSLSVGEAFIEAYKLKNPKDEIIHIDLFKKNIPHLDGQLIAMMFGKMKPHELDEEHQQKMQALQNNLNEFIKADKYVFAVPLWNYGNPPVVRAYFDNISVINQTFKYTENGSIGLLNNKKAICIQASGGIYSAGPAAKSDHGAAYIKSILELFDVTCKIIYVEGVDILTLDADKIKKEAIKMATQLANEF